MLTVRFWRQTDLPDLMRMAAITTWNITPPDDQAHTTFEKVAQSGQQNLMGVLASPFGTAVVADWAGRPVGYLLIGIQPHDRTGEPIGYLADIYIEPEFRRMGVAGHLHRVGEDYLRRIGIRRASNWTHAHNQTGQKSATRHGYRVWGVMMSKELRQ